MRTKFNFYYLLIFLSSGVLLTSVNAFSQKNDNIYKILGWEEHYTQAPNVQGCFEGVLKDSEKAEVLNYVNFIRSIHGLKPVQYDLNGDKYAQKSSLIMAANSALNHQPPSGWSCYSNDGYYGADNSNLHLNRSTSNTMNPKSIESIIGWMIDDKSGNAPDRCGHRRAIINPFLTSIAFGRVDGKSNVDNYYCSGMSLLYLDRVNGGIQDRPVEFVAYPFQNYPIELVNKSWYLSFSPFYDMNSWGRNTNINYSSAKVTVTDDNGNQMNVHSYVDDAEGWGAIHNNFRWMVDGMQNEVKYNVNIKGIVVNGQTKEYNYWFKLTANVMGLKPNTPVLSYPADEASNMPFNLAFSWSISEFTYKYRFQLSKSADMSKPIKDEASISNGYIVNGLEQLTTYYWRVKAINDVGESDWTPIRSFTTAAPKPDKPELVYPPNESTEISITPTLSWKLIPSAEEYQVQVSLKNDFSGFTVIVDSYTPDTTYTVPFEKLDAKTTYFWRVRSKAGGQNSTWSTTWKFQTKQPDPVPDVATLNEPKLNGVNIKLNAKFSWSKVEYAKEYKLQISKTSMFPQQDIVFNKTVETNEYQLMGNEMLQPKTKYFWRVQSLGEAGFSNWSTTYNFTTEEGQKVTNYLFNNLVELFPNPTDDYLILSFRYPEVISSVEILDIFGNKLTTLSDISTESIRLSLNGYSSGLYFVKVTTPKGIILEKFLKK